jgi:hypothetical protein
MPPRAGGQPASSHLRSKVEGFSAQQFRWNQGEIEPAEEAARVLRLEDGRFYVCGDYGGAPIWAQDGQRVEPLGLNTAPVSTLLRRVALPTAPTGGAHLRWPDQVHAPDAATGLLFGVLILVRQTVHAHSHTVWVEVASSLHCFVVNEPGALVPLNGEEKWRLLEGLVDATVRVRPEGSTLAESLTAAMSSAERQLVEALRRPTDDELARGIQYGVTPLFAAVVGR